MTSTGELIQARYEIIRPLGSGGFGSVFLARDTRLGRTVALKQMAADRLGAQDRQVAATLFEREARMLAQLDHPGLTNIWDYFQDDGRVVLVMEYVPGQTLRDLLLTRQRLPEAFVRACALQLCDVLSYLHSRTPPVIFRDLKPANVMVVAPSLRPDADMLAEDPAALTFKLIDFGIARFFTPNQSGDTLVIGTPGYAAPEQYGQGQTDARSDLYALGATLYALLSGQTPALLMPPLSQVAPEVSPGMARLVTRACAYEPPQRYQTADALRRDLLALPAPRPAAAPGTAPLEEPEPAAPRPTTPLPPPPLPSRPSQPALSPAVVALVVLGLLAGLGLAAHSMLTVASDDYAAPGPPTAAAGPTAAAEQREWLLPGATGRIAFAQESGAGAYYDLAVASLDGRPPQTVVGDGRSFGVAWSPDGERLAFARVLVDQQQTAIMVGAPGASAAAQVFRGDGYARYPAWSPDGSRLAFAIAPNRNGNFRLAILDLASGRVSYPGPDRVAWLTWSRQRGLTYASRSGLTAQDIFALGDDGQPRNLTNTPDVEEDFPIWSPDGSRLAFVASPYRRLDQRRIAVMEADGGGVKTLTKGPQIQTNPVWSPDGAWLAYLSAPPDSPTWQVWAMRPNGSDQRQLTFQASQKFYLSWGE